MCHSGAEKTREELRKQVYDAMADEEQTEVTAPKLKSEDPNGTPEVKKENGVAVCPVTNVAESEKPSKSPVNPKKSSDQEAVENADKSPSAPVNGEAESPDGSPRMNTVNVKDSREQNGEVTTTKPEEGKDEESKSEAVQDKEEAEGSKLLDTEHCWCGWVQHNVGVFLVLNYKHYHMLQKVKGNTVFLKKCMSSLI